MSCIRAPERAASTCLEGVLLCMHAARSRGVVQGLSVECHDWLRRPGLCPSTNWRWLVIDNVAELDLRTISFHSRTTTA